MSKELRAWASGIPFEGDIDVDWFCDVPNGHVARKRLEFLSQPANVSELMKRGYGGEPLTRMWRAVYQACVAHGEPIPSARHGHAEQLGVRVPE